MKASIPSKMAIIVGAAGWRMVVFVFFFFVSFVLLLELGSFRTGSLLTTGFLMFSGSRLMKTFDSP